MARCGWLGMTGQWVGLSSSYTSTLGGPLTLRIVNSNLAASGNDFAVDDINFSTSTTVPEAATWTMLVAGFGLVGAATRRRVRTVAA